ncbi:hypothetical protein DFJ73DRAFT_958884 [Zopfochytrium polystomum]|nr:hypothetical protein DFJ73DRAFT_958884 [Zopfochytrium polystomum]
MPARRDAPPPPPSPTIVAVAVIRRPRCRRRYRCRFGSPCRRQRRRRPPYSSPLLFHLPAYLLAAALPLCLCPRRHRPAAAARAHRDPRADSPRATRHLQEAAAVLRVLVHGGRGAGASYGPSCPFGTPRDGGEGGVSRKTPGFVEARFSRKAPSARPCPPPTSSPSCTSNTNCPPLPTLVDTILTRLVARYPRFRSLPVEVNGEITWAELPVSEVSLMDHITQLDLPTPADVTAKLESLLNHFWDPARPLWHLYLVHAPGADAVVLDMHHGLGDGVSLVLVAAALCTASPAARCPTPGHLLLQQPHIQNDHHHGRATTTTTTAQPLSDRLSLRRGRRNASHPRPLDRRHPVLDQSPAPLHPLRPPPPLPAVKRVKSAIPGATVNDVVLALLAGAYRRYLNRTDPAIVPDLAADQPRLLVRAGSAISLPRPPPSPDGGGGGLHNRFVYLSAGLPVGLAGPPSRRIRAARAGMSHVKGGAAAAVQIASQRFTAATSGRGVLASLTYQFASRHSVGVSNLRGPEAPLAVCGVEVERIVPIVSSPANTWIVFSYCDLVYFSCNVVPKLYKDLSLLERCFELEFQDMLREIE